MRTGHAHLLWLFTGLFALRVLGQAIQLWWPQRLLPHFDSFQGSRLPYGVLLASQLVILATMLHYAWRAQRGALPRNERAGRVLLWLGWIYMTGSIARIAVGLLLPEASAWFRAWIPATFHLVLAGYVLTLGYHRRRG